MNNIDHSPEALQKRREIAEKTNYDDWFVEEDLNNADQVLKKDEAAHIAANSPDAVIAMIDEIERLRKENPKLLEIWKALPPALMEENKKLEKEADWLARKLTDNINEYSPCPEDCNSCIRECLQEQWREAASRAAVRCLKHNQ